MRISLSVTNFSWPGGPPALAASLAEVAVAAEAAGLDTLWVADHLIQAGPGSAPDAEMLEAYTTLGFLAARTARPARRDGQPVTYREPALLLKAVTTLDVLSGGRAWLGVGVGYPSRGGRDGPVAAAHGRALRAARGHARLAEQCGRATSRRSRDAHRLERPVSRPRPCSRPASRSSSAAWASAGRCGWWRATRSLQPVRHPRRRRDRAPQARGAATAPARPPGGVRRGREDDQHPAGPGEDAGLVAERLTASAGWASSTPCSSRRGRGRWPRCRPSPTRRTACATCAARAATGMEGCAS